MKYLFKPGDIVVLIETETQIGNLDLSFLSKVRKEQEKARYRNFRGEVVKILEDNVDKDGDPCFRLRRLDTKGHGLETWSQAFFVLDRD